MHTHTGGCGSEARPDRASESIFTARGKKKRDQEPFRSIVIANIPRSFEAGSQAAGVRKVGAMARLGEMVVYRLAGKAETLEFAARFLGLDLALVRRCVAFADYDTRAMRDRKPTLEEQGYTVFEAEIASGCRDSATGEYFGGFGGFGGEDSPQRAQRATEKDRSIGVKAVA